MSNTYGRQVVLPLTNKSGGGVIAGDVVIIDTTNDAAFTTTTSAGYTGFVGIAQDTIAANAIGRVLTAGYAALVNVNASVTRGHFGSTHTVAKQAASAGASRVVGVFCQFLTGGTTPTAHVLGFPDASSATGNVATDAIWDAAGDLAVGTGANTAARLASGAAGTVLTGAGVGSAPTWAAASAGALVLLEQYTASASATLDFTSCISSTYDDYRIEILNLVPATNNANAILRVSTDGGSSYDSGSNYQWTALRDGTPNVNTAATSIALDQGTGADGLLNTASYGGLCSSLTLFNPLNSSQYKFVAGVGSFVNHFNNNHTSLQTSGAYKPTTAVNAIQFLMSSGNIASGTIRVYGVAKS